MNEGKKTLVFLAVAGVMLLLGIEPWRGMAPARKVETEVGKNLFPDLDKLLAGDERKDFPVKQLEVQEYDESTGDVRPFNVGTVGGRWALPSKEGYPADAQDHMAAAANALSGVQILGMVSSQRSEQEMYGVVEPPAESGEARKGVGKRITLRDENGKVLADLIVGKEVKDAKEQRYVRRPGKDPIYVVKVDVEKFSTKFEDWIEKDLLQMSLFDLRTIKLRDQSAKLVMSPEQGPMLQRELRCDATLASEEGKNAWQLAELLDYTKNVATKYQLKPDEVLNQEKVSALKSALGELKIVDVLRKPESLSKNLKTTEEFIRDQESARSLMSLGFYPVPVDNDQGIAISSTEGEVICTLKDGVEYVLRFGQEALSLDTGKEKPADDDSKEEGESHSLSPNRYVFVSVRYNPNMIPKPELDPLPPTEEASPADASADKTDKEPAKEDEAKSDDEKKEVSPAAAERSRIEKENERRQKDYDDRVAKAKERINLLNERFADWFYVVSDNVYRKIRLGHEDLVRTKPAESDAPAKPGLPAGLPLRKP